MGSESGFGSGSRSGHRSGCEWNKMISSVQARIEITLEEREMLRMQDPSLCFCKYVRDTGDEPNMQMLVQLGKRYYQVLINHRGGQVPKEWGSGQVSQLDERVQRAKQEFQVQARDEGRVIKVDFRNRRRLT